MRRKGLFCSLLLVAVTGLGTGAAAPAASAGPPTSTQTTGFDKVVPAPSTAEQGGPSYQIGENTRIRVAGKSGPVHDVGDYLAGLLRPSTGFDLPVTSQTGRDGIQLALSDNLRSLGGEGYRLDVDGQAVKITAWRPDGLFHGVQTLRQLLPASVEQRTVQSGPWLVAGGTITDEPRFEHRGAMLDVSRHFFTVDKVKRYIDQLALYKVNRLHLHLSDDQGWRIAIDSWPRLATYGGSTQVGGGPGGYYTKDDYREIVAYADSRFMTVIPEIDMPGHTNAALASYAELNCDGIAPPLYTGTAVGFSSLCVPEEITYDFVDDVIRELAALTPGRYIHIGGDEAHSTPHDQYVVFMERAQAIVAKYGKTVVGWHQLADADPVPGAVAQYWGFNGSEQYVIDAAKAGTKVVLSPANRLYLDMKYNRDTPLGLSWAGFVEVRQAYDWNPGAFLQGGVPESAVLGVEAPLWAETISTSDHIEFMAFPRVAGLGELGWSPASTHDWDAYKVRLAAQGPRWEAMGIDFYRSPQVPWV